MKIDWYEREKWENKFGKISDEVFDFINKDESANKIINMINRLFTELITIHNKEANKYAMIEHVIKAFHKGKCPRCNQSGLSEPQDQKMFDNPYKCAHCKAEYMQHELPIAYLWSIDNIIHERVDKL